jgi:RNA polymerase sigma-70 factor (ECF subfamily)
MGGEGRFLTTRWSVVLQAGRAGAAQGPGAEEARAALERLAESYWAPLHAYVRRRGYGEEEARDLTQDFFARLLERRDVAEAAPERGRFRSFLLTALQRFLINAEERARAQKRGGGRKPLSLDATDGGGRALCEPSHDETAERAFERAWAGAVLARTLARLEEDYSARGKRALFEALRGHLVGEAGGTPYAELGERLGLSEGAVKLAMHRLRARYRACLRAEVADTLERPADVEDELRRLFEALG